MTRLYYTPPPNDQFKEVKECAIKVWQRYDNEFGYVDEKVNRIKDLKNVGDNFMYIVAMFDVHNQIRLAFALNKETKLAIRERMIDGGMPEEYIYF